MCRGGSEFLLCDVEPQSGTCITMLLLWKVNIKGFKQDQLHKCVASGIRGSCIGLIICHHFLEFFTFWTRGPASYLASSGSKYPVHTLISGLNVCHIQLTFNIIWHILSLKTEGDFTSEWWIQHFPIVTCFQVYRVDGILWILAVPLIFLTIPSSTYESLHLPPRPLVLGTASLSSV